MTCLRRSSIKMKPKLFVLGAGIFQVRLIRLAQALGYETHVLSISGDYPGISEADAFHPIDTRDVGAVVRCAKKLRPAGVLTAGSDVCMPALGAVCDELNLRGISQSVAEMMTFKERFREFQRRSGLRCPRSVAARTLEELRDRVRELVFPVIVKPSDASGSRGISLAASADSGILRAAFAGARASSTRGIVCAEEILPGTEVGGNCLLQEKRIIFLATTAKHMEGFLVRGHSYPTKISSHAQVALRESLEECCEKLGYADGALNFDVMVDGDQVTIIEAAARLGGNGLTDLTEHAFGYNIEREVVRIAAGESATEFREGSFVVPCGSLVFGSNADGVLRNLATLEEIQRPCPWVFGITNQRRIGNTVRAMRHNAELIGYALFDIPASRNWESCSRMILQNLGLVVSPES